MRSGGYIIDIGGDAADAPDLRSAISTARAFVKRKAVMQGGSWVNADEAVVFRSNDKEPMFAIWRVRRSRNPDESKVYEIDAREMSAAAFKKAIAPILKRIRA